MKHLLYVYVPGFEYDSKGPLHIDAIRLNVTVGGSKENTESETNSLNTYCYIKLDGEKIPCNVIYRYSTEVTNPDIIKRYNGQPTTSALWTSTENFDRVPHGMFNDLIVSDNLSETTHHIIGIHSTPERCKENISNFNTEEHDGLFIVELENLDTDMVLTFTFYSKIDESTPDSHGKITVGTMEHDSMYNFTDQLIYENVSDFNSKYIEIGKWVKTYNPAIEGSLPLETIDGEFVSLYFDIDRNDNFLWEVPVNGEVLVTNTGSQLLGRSFYLQFSYDSLTLKHKLVQSLPCNNRTDIPSFYTDFYPKFDTRHNTEYTKNICLRGAVWGHRPSAGLMRERDFICYCKFNSSDYLTSTYKYKLCYVNTDSLSYLYTHKPQITLMNLSQSSVGNLNWDITSLFAINTHTCTLNNKSGIRQPKIYNLYHFKNNPLNSASTNSIWEYLTEKEGASGYDGVWQKLHDKATYPLPTLSISLSQSLPGEQASVLVNNKRINLDEDANSSWLSTHGSDAFKRQYNESISTLPTPSSSTDYAEGKRYVGKITKNDINTSNILAEESLDIVLKGNNTLLFDIKINESFMPAILFGGSNSNSTIDPDRLREYFDGINEGANSNEEVPTWPSYKIPLNSDGITYNYLDYLNRWKIGQVHFGIQPMLQIDLKTSLIRYSNVGDWQVLPIIIQNKGYSHLETSSSLVDANVPKESVNLLIDQDSDVFELQLLLGDKCKSIKDLYFLTRDSEKFDTTICKDARFFGVSSLNDAGLPIDIIIGKTLSLTEGLYVFRVLTLYPCEQNGINRFKLTIKLGDDTSKEIESRNGRFLFYVNGGTTVQIEKLNVNLKVKINTRTYYDVISGIGLYKVNTNLTDNNTLALNQVLENINETKVITQEDNIDSFVIFPSVFCAKENTLVCDRLSPYRQSMVSSLFKARYNSNYNNDYCTSKQDDPLRHNYNFSYLPEKAVYEVVAFYVIPDGILETPRSIELFSDTLLNLAELLNKKVRVCTQSAAI